MFSLLIPNVWTIELVVLARGEHCLHEPSQVELQELSVDHARVQIRSKSILSSEIVLATGEFIKSVREMSSQQFVTLYTLSIYPSAHSWYDISWTLFVNFPEQKPLSYLDKKVVIHTYNMPYFLFANCL